MFRENATSSILIALHAAGGAPEWVQLLPVGVITTNDGRGPYRMTNADELAATSLQAAGGKLAIDENHSTDLAAPEGLPSPARGWIIEMQARADGLWGKVEWTDEGRGLVASHAYRGISPVFVHNDKGEVLRVLRASLTNTPNLRGLTALHSQETYNMDLLAQLRELLDLPADADAAAVIAAVKDVKSKTSMQAALAPIAKAAGLKDEADAAAIAGAVTALAAEAKHPKGEDQIKALQTELATVTTSLNSLRKERATERATAFVDGAIKAGRVGIKPLRDHYIARHAADPEGVEKEIGALPILGPSGAAVVPPERKDGKVALNAEQLHTCKVLGMDPEAYRKTLEAEQAADLVA